MDDRRAIEKVMCANCAHVFDQHEDCERCAKDRRDWHEQENAKLLPVEFHGVALGDVYSQTIRLVI